MNKELSDKLAEETVDQWACQWRYTVPDELTEDLKQKFSQAINQATSELQGKVAGLREALEHAEMAVNQAIRENLIPEGETGGQRMFWRNTKVKIEKALTNTQSTAQAYTQKVREEAIREVQDLLINFPGGYDEFPQALQSLLTKKEGDTNATT